MSLNMMPPNFEIHDLNSPSSALASERRIGEFDSQLKKSANNPSISHAMNIQAPINILMHEQNYDTFNKQNQGNSFNSNQYFSDPNQPQFGKYDSGNSRSGQVQGQGQGQGHYSFQEPKVILFVSRHKIVYRFLLI